ncbi:MAG: carbohydrate ABC transporter permease [Actinobacteria bacterium]|nr:carbohydrate ABC transporter permease [Actinomycetota bacterium]
MKLKLLKKDRKIFFIYGINAVILIWTLFPLYWVLNASLQTNNDLFSVPPKFFAVLPTLAAYKRILFASPGMKFPFSILNSLEIAISSTMISIVIGALAAFVFARLSFKGKGILLLVVIITQLLPYITTLAPLYEMFLKVGLIDKKLALVFGYTAWTLPVATWILYGYFRSIPKDIDDAARVDGCTRIGSLVRILLPISSPGLIAAATYCFIYGMSEFLYALVFTTSYNSKTLPVVLAEYVGRFQIDYPAISAGAVIASLFPIIFALIFQRYLVKGLTAGALK